MSSSRRSDRWLATKFAAFLGTIGSLVHVVRALDSSYLPAAPLPVLIAFEFVATLSAGQVVECLRPVRSRSRAMLVGSIAALPGAFIGIPIAAPGLGASVIVKLALVSAVVIR